MADPDGLARLWAPYRLAYVRDGMKKTYQFDNPNVSSTCGCGESFNLKKV